MISKNTDDCKPLTFKELYSKIVEMSNLDKEGVVSEQEFKDSLIESMMDGNVYVSNENGLHFKLKGIATPADVDFTKLWLLDPYFEVQ